MAIYMKYDAIKGDVSASGHEQWIELSSFKYDITRAISAQTGSKGDRETSAPTIGEVVITKRTDRATVGLLGEAYQGHGKKVQIDFCKTDKGQVNAYAKWGLENVLISGYSFSTAEATGPGAEHPRESISLNFTVVTFTEYGSDVTGKIGNPSTIAYDAAQAKVL